MENDSGRPPSNTTQQLQNALVDKVPPCTALSPRYETVDGETHLFAFCIQKSRRPALE